MVFEIFPERYSKIIINIIISSINIILLKKNQYHTAGTLSFNNKWTEYNGDTGN